MFEEEKTATVKIYRDNVPRITVTYKNKKDLFEKFQKKLKALNLPPGEVYWTDPDNDRVPIKTAEDLFTACQDTIVKMYYQRTFDREPRNNYPSSDDDDEEEKSEEKKVSVKDESRSRSCSPAPRRQRSRSASYHGHRRHGPPAYDQMPWNFGPWNFMMDPRYGPMAFPPQHHHRRPKSPHRRHREESHHCHDCTCEGLSKEFGKL